PRLQLAVRPSCDAVVDDSPVRTGTRDGVEADLLQRLRLAADRLEPARGRDLVELAVRRLAIEPSQEAGDRCAVPLVGRARTLDLGGVLAGLGQQAWVRTAHDGCLATGKLAEEPARRCRRIEQNAPVRCPQGSEAVVEGGGLADLGERRQMRLRLRTNLGWIDEELC